MFISAKWNGKEVPELLKKSFSPFSLKNAFFAKS